MSSPQSKQTCYSQELHTAQQWKKLHVHLCYNRENHPSKTKLQISDKYIDKQSNFSNFFASTAHCTVVDKTPIPIY